MEKTAPSIAANVANVKRLLAILDLVSTFYVLVDFAWRFSYRIEWGRPQMHRQLRHTRVSKWFEIAHICHQAQGGHIIQWLCFYSKLTTIQLYDVAWNPRIAESLPRQRCEMRTQQATRRWVLTYGRARRPHRKAAKNSIKKPGDTK